MPQMRGTGGENSDKKSWVELNLTHPNFSLEFQIPVITSAYFPILQHIVQMKKQISISQLQVSSPMAKNHDHGTAAKPTFGQCFNTKKKGESKTSGEPNSIFQLWNEGLKPQKKPRK